MSVVTLSAVSARAEPAGSIGLSYPLAASPALESSKQCFYRFPDCTSTDPAVVFRLVSIGGTVGCSFDATLDWGDGVISPASFNGGFDGTTLYTFRHTYADQPATFKLHLTIQISGPCGDETSNYDSFTLLAPKSGCAGGRSEITDAISRNTTPKRVIVEGGSWAGYVSRAPSECTFTSVTGQWVQPKIICPKRDIGKDLAVSFWVGLDGYKGSDTVEQTGVGAECVWHLFGYRAEYYAWYEMFPRESFVFDGLDPEPGSAVKATVIYDGEGEYSLNLAVTSDGRTRTASIEEKCHYDCQNISAEWIAEKPQKLDSADVVGLPDFAPWDLTDGEATTVANPQERSVESFDPQGLSFASDGIRAVPAGLGDSSFTVATIPAS
jgi:hypothetical protein